LGNLTTTGGLTLAGVGGSFVGTINTGGLLVDAQGGSAALTGFVNGASGAAAAAAASITPAVNANYTLNGCAIGAASCGAGGVTLASALSSPSVATPAPAATQTTLDPAVIGGLSLNRLLPGAPPAQAILPQLDLVVPPNPGAQNQ
jgi:hypothetical protein